MKKIFSMIVGILTILSVAFADVVVPLDGIPGLFGATYSRVRGIDVNPVIFIFTLVLFVIITAIITLIVRKIIKDDKKKKNATIFIFVLVGLFILLGLIEAIIYIV